LSISRQEEAIACLWLIAAVLAFGYGFTVWGWVFAVKAGMDTLCAIGFGIAEIRAHRASTLVSRK
jgi:CHASE2 domain-containing sensor protein